MLENKYGHFSKDGKEYIITNPFTPKPWINVISNGDYSLIVTQTGGGYSFRGNAEQNRLTRSFQDTVKDNWGKYFYIRDLKTNKFWSAGALPISDGATNCTVTHGIGYSVLQRVTENIQSTLTVFADSQRPMEYLKLELQNVGESARLLDVTSYFEWACGIAYDTHREFARLFYDLQFSKQINGIVANKCLWGFPDSKGRWNNDDWPYTAFFNCSEEVDSFECDKEAFLGMYRDEKTPLAMENAALTNSCGRYCEPIASLRVKVELGSGEKKTILFTLGMAKKGEENFVELAKRCQVNVAETELNTVKEKWLALLDKEKVNTPDQALNVMTNYWLKYQALSGRMWAKAAYYQISGGIGFRDQLQDSHIGLESDPDITRKQLLLHASKQFKQGDVLHWWLTYNNAGPRTKCSDDFLWLPFTVINYLAETLDVSLLDEQIPFLDGESADMYTHCKNAILYSFSMFSTRGIPLMGAHDWNDGLSAVGHGMKGESFWVAEFLYWIINRFDKIAESRGDNQFATLMREKAVCLKRDFNKYAWDGEWFLQATNDLGEKIGSRENSQGKIFLNPQIWAVIADITDEDRKKKAMESVSKYLLRDHGALLLYPEYTKPNSEIGYITRYAPGLRENGGVYTHAATWAVWAYALMGDNESAYKAYQGICPPNNGKNIDNYKAEPYVTAGNSDGPNSPYFGRGSWSWYSGSAQWLHRVAVQCILGVVPCKDGLRISPCIPDLWDRAEYRRVFRGATYDIIIERASDKGITLDGKPLADNVVPSCSNGNADNTVLQWHTVHVKI